MTQDAPILVLNAGSATLKYRLVSTDRDVTGGLVEHIAEPGGLADHRVAVAQALDAVSAWRPAAVGHRVVHGGSELCEPVRIDEVAEEAIDRLCALAPAHNPAALAGIRAARTAYPDIPHVAVFDTAFHAKLPAAAYTYAVDRDVAAAYGLRRYGFHGISVRYVRDRTATLLGRSAAELNMIVMHLGNGASVTALAGGVSVDTSMGMSPLAGLVMGTRTGDIDPTITFQLARDGWSMASIEDLYQHRGGVFGLCGDNDMRVVERRASSGDEAAELALAVYCHRLRTYLGAYHAVLGRLDAIVFTAGVGEHSAVVRARALAGLEPLGIEVDAPANEAAQGPCVISTPGSRVTVCVVPTDEERAIAQEAGTLLGLPGW